MRSTPAFQRAQQLFEELLDVDPEEQRLRLEALRGDEDLGVYEQVAALLQAHERAQTAALFPALFEPEAPPLTGRSVGAYDILRELGAGGMGVVYLAERSDGQFRKRVALKVIKRGMDTEDILRRFLHERQILASLEHPNIARILDGGVTEDGRPYFVMEYAEGLPITDYCDRNRLSTEERLALFERVCAAVQYAHQNLVVHRDIKPSNLIVTPEGELKLLDFGIAKLLNPGLSAQSVPITQTEMRLMTPEYAAPEQVRGEPITTMTDVYALGVLLYELLTGHRPFRLKSRLLQEIERVICEAEPEKPSTVVTREEEVETSEGTTRITPEMVSRARQTRPEMLRRRLSGDLDNIVLMAMRKEPGRRYGSAEQLAADIRRYLRDLPVVARQDALAYRCAKFLRRHKVGVLSASAVVLALLGGLGAALWQNRIARAQRDLAVHAATTMITELSEGLSGMSGPTQNRLGLLLEAARVFEQISTAAVSPGRLWQHADAYRKLASTYQTMGDAAGALTYARKAVELARGPATGRGAPVMAQLTHASSLLTLGDALQASGQADEALAAYGQAVEAADRLPVSEDTLAFRGRHYWLHLALVRRGDLLLALSRPDSAALHYGRAHDAIRVLTSRYDRNATYHNLHATSIERLADMLYAANDVAASCARYREALDVRTRARQLAPDDVAVLQSLAVSMQNVGWCLEWEGHPDQTVPLYREAIALQRDLLQKDPANVRLATNLMGGVGELGSLLLRQGDRTGALQKYREALAVAAPFRERGIRDPGLDQMIADIEQLLADAL